MKEYPEYTTDFAALADHLDVRLQKALGSQTWLGQTKAGLEVVIKGGPGADPEVYDFLKKCQSLYPSFEYPQIISAEPGFYLIYRFIPGESFAEGDFEAQKNLDVAFELSGRVTALCRSLKLAPMFQGLQTRAPEGAYSQEESTQHLTNLGRGFDYRLDGLAVRRAEASRSYAWAQHRVEYCQVNWSATDFRVPWEALRERVETVTSIHLTMQGSNLAHTCFTPEHILMIGEDKWGLVGWQVAPRPYNYMRYRYLAWCLIHTSRDRIQERYQNLLHTMPTIHISTANSLTFALCLLETWIDIKKKIKLRAEKIQAVSNFIEAALAGTEEDQADWQEN